MAWSVSKILILLLLITTLVAPVKAGSVECNGKTWTLDGQADQVEINEAINSGDYVKLSGNDICINDPIKIDSNTVLDGQGITTIKLGNNVNRNQDSEYRHKATNDYATVMVPLIGQTSENIENIEIKGINFNGNNENNKDVIDGRAFYNFVYFKHANGVKFHDNYATNSHGDFLRCFRSSNIHFYNNKADYLGHDGFFCIETTNVEANNNNIDCHINSAIRFNDVDNGYIHDNTITANSKDSGPGIQIQRDLNGKMRIIVCNNNIGNTWGPGLWITGKAASYDSSLTSVWIHHNAFIGTAANTNIEWVGGVLTSAFHGIVIENNVFDGVHGFAWTTKQVKGLQAGDSGAGFTSIVKNNIITNTLARSTNGVGTGGAYQNNLASSHVLKNSGNILWNNANDDVPSSDVRADPKINPGNSEWKWSNNKWTCANISVSTTPVIPTTNYWDTNVTANPEHSDREDEPVAEKEFDLFYNLETTNFTDSGLVTQNEDEIEWTKKAEHNGKMYGRVQAYPKNLIYLEGQPYIKDQNDIGIKEDIITDPSLIWWSNTVDYTNKSVNITNDSNNTIVNLSVTLKWHNTISNQFTGKKHEKPYEQTVYFTDKIPKMPVLECPDEMTPVYITYYINDITPHIKVRYTVDNVTKITYETPNGTAIHQVLLGESHIKDGLRYTNFTSCDSWDGDIGNFGNDLSIEGTGIQPEQIKIIVETPFNTFVARNYIVSYQKWEYGDSIHPFVYFFVVSIVFFAYFARKFIKLIIFFNK